MSKKITDIELPPGISQLADKRWMARWQPIDPKTGKPQWKRRIRDTLPQAIEELERMKVEGVGGRVKPMEEPVLEFASKWMRRKKKHLRVGVQDRYYSDLELHFLPTLGDTLCSQLTAGDIDDWLDDCTERNRWVLRDKYLAEKAIAKGRKPRPPHEPAPYANDTINGWLATVKRMTSAMAIEKGISDPGAGVRPLPSKVRQEHESNTLEPDEISSLLSHCFEHQPQWYGFMVLGFLLGARPGELRPLRLKIDLNLETGRLILQQSETRGVVNPTKTNEPRKVDMPAELITAMAWHVDWLKKSGHPGAGSGLVFPGWGRWRPWYKVPVLPSKEVQFMSPSAFDKPLAAMRKAVGITKHITPRAMRRSAHDTGRGLQVDPIVMEVLIGHQSQAMRGRYSTVGMAEKKRALEGMTNLYRLPTTARTPEQKAK